jgi:nitrogen fixation-related uncharacterized protein
MSHLFINLHQYIVAAVAFFSILIGAESGQYDDDYTIVIRRRTQD